MNLSRHLISVFAAGTAAAALTACGGGGSFPAIAETSGVTVSGTAATGAAIAAGIVTLKCVSGVTSSPTTGSDGSFSIDIGAVTLPCVGRVDYKDASGMAQKLHTFISAPGTANITPITELVIASLTGGTAVDAFDKFDVTKTKSITTAQVTTAIAAVKTYFGTLGVSIIDFPTDPISTKFIAKNGSTLGDRSDAVLDALAANLTANKRKLSDAVSDLTTGIRVTAGGGCTDKVSALFSKNKGIYPSNVALFALDQSTLAAGTKVAGFADNASVNLVINESCTISLGSTVLAYKEGSYKEFSGQVNVGLSAPGFTVSGLEFFSNGKLGATICEDSNKACANVFPK